MGKLKRTEWVEQQKRNYDVDKLVRLEYPHLLYWESVNAFIKGLFLASIMCTEVAMNSLLMQKLNRVPKLKKSAKNVIQKTGNILRVHRQHN